MAYRKSDFIFDRISDRTGFATYADVYSAIQDNVDQLSEFYEIEPAVVNQVYLSPESLPTISTSNGDKVPDYSLYGTIKARFLESQSDGDEIPGFIKPLSAHVSAYPVVGEVVNIAKYGNQFYYYLPLNLHNHVNMNISAAGKIDGKVKPGVTQYNRTLASKKGDLNINGRFGHGIKFNSNEDYRFPTVRISNLQHNDRRKYTDDYFPHISNINLDGSTILLSSGLINEKNDVLVPAAQSSWWPEKWKSAIDKNTIILNSDCLIFNAKGKNGDIHLIANRNVAIASNYSVTLEAGEAGVINLGDADATNPAVKGKEVKDVFIKLMSIISDFSAVAGSTTEFADLNNAAKKMAERLAKLKENNLDEIFSDTVFLTDGR